MATDQPEMELCPACERGHLHPTCRAGRRMPLKQIPDLEIPADVALPTCNSCGAEILGGADLAALGSAMTRAYAQALASKSEASIRALNAALPQRDLERLIDVSAGYLSKLKNGQSEPSGPLSALLMLLASEPQLVNRLRELWSMRATVDSRFWQARSRVPFITVTQGNDIVDFKLPAMSVPGRSTEWAEARVDTDVSASRPNSGGPRLVTAGGLAG